MYEQMLAMDRDLDWLLEAAAVGQLTDKELLWQLDWLNLRLMRLLARGNGRQGIRDIPKTSPLAAGLCVRAFGPVPTRTLREPLAADALAYGSMERET